MLTLCRRGCADANRSAKGGRRGRLPYLDATATLVRDILDLSSKSKPTATISG